ncbi:hypothetical protein AABM26_14975 [Curtobacterium aetherium]|uniref:hypothetical protein n=1 Tax=Curtobacterium aetherium TaxID=2841594 RepID=UPI003B52B868
MSKVLKPRGSNSATSVAAWIICAGTFIVIAIVLPKVAWLCVIGAALAIAIAIRWTRISFEIFPDHLILRNLLGNTTVRREDILSIREGQFLEYKEKDLPREKLILAYAGTGRPGDGSPLGQDKAEMMRVVEAWRLGRSNEVQ